MTQEGVSAAFCQLESASAFIPNEYKTKEAGLVTKWGPVLLALDSTGRRQLLLPVQSVGTEPIDQRTNGVHVLPLLLDPQSSTKAGKKYAPYFLAIICLKEHLEDVFSLLAADILNSVQAQPSRPEEATMQVLDKWHEFLSRERSLKLSDNEVAGLIGELLVLRELIALSKASILNWHGPGKVRHDFANAKAALEVKTTTARSGWTFEIHGHDQLEKPLSTPLFFAGLRLQKDPAGSLNLPKLVAEIKATGISVEEFERRLMDVGYLSTEASLYEEMRFEQQERRLYLVDDNFPKMTSDSFSAHQVPVGVEKIRYAINLNGAVPRILDNGTVAKVFADLAATP